MTPPRRSSKRLRTAVTVPTIPPPPAPASPPNPAATTSITTTTKPSPADQLEALLTKYTKDELKRLLRAAWGEVSARRTEVLTLRSTIKTLRQDLTLAQAQQQAVADHGEPFI